MRFNLDSSMKFLVNDVMSVRLFLLLIITVIFISCDEPALPRQRGYIRLELPSATYKEFDPANCPFSFQINNIAEAVPDTNALAEPCWWYINYPSLNGKIYISYKAIKNDFSAFAEDARTLVYKHTQRASAINEELISNEYGASGILYEIGGNAASAIQFYMTDSSKHFLRGALYFNSVPNSDSLSPVISYAKADIEQMLSSLKWK